MLELLYGCVSFPSTNREDIGWKLQFPSFMLDFFQNVKGRIALENGLLHRIARKKAINNKYSSFEYFFLFSVYLLRLRLRINK